MVLLPKDVNNFGIYIISIKEGTDLSKLIIIADFKTAHHTFNSLQFCKMLPEPGNKIGTFLF